MAVLAFHTQPVRRNCFFFSFDKYLKKPSSVRISTETHSRELFVNHNVLIRIKTKSENTHTHTRTIKTDSLYKINPTWTEDRRSRLVHALLRLRSVQAGGEFSCEVVLWLEEDRLLVRSPYVTSGFVSLGF